MEAIEFLKAAKRRYECDKIHHANSIYLNCDFEGYVNGVEEWAKEHPVKTRQTEFLKMFPNITMNDRGFVDISPCNLDKKIYERCKTGSFDCCECYKQFWNEEVE